MKIARSVPVPPAAGEGRVPSWAPSAGLDHTWQREMEKAQAQGWFQGPLQQEPRPSMPAVSRAVVTPKADAAADRTPDPAASSARQGGPARAASHEDAVPVAAQPVASPPTHFESLASAIAKHAPKQAAGATPVLPAQDLEPMAMQPLPASGAEPQVLIPAASIPAPALAPARKLQDGLAPLRPAVPDEPVREPPPPVRMHIESGEDGVRVWLGLDGDAAEVQARAAALALQLRRELATDSRRLAAVVCNGRLVYAPHTVPQPPNPFPPHQET